MKGGNKYEVRIKGRRPFSFLYIILLLICLNFVGSSESPDRDCCEPLYPFIITNNTKISGNNKIFKVNYQVY